MSSNAVSVVKTDEQRELDAQIIRIKPRLLDVLPKHLTFERLLHSIQAACMDTPSLLECLKTRDGMASMLIAALRAALWGLEPNTPLGQCYLIPFKKKVVLVPGYRGLITLLYNTGRIEDVGAVCVYDDDRYRVVYDPAPRIEYQPSEEEDRGGLRAVYAYFKLTGSPIYHVEPMTRAEVLAIRNKSASWQYKQNESPWKDKQAEPEMWKKTAIKRGTKYLPMSIDKHIARLQNVVDVDNAAERGEVFTADLDPEVTADLGLGQEKPKSGVQKLKEKVAPKPEAEPEPNPAPEDETEPEPPYGSGKFVLFENDEPPVVPGLPFEPGSQPFNLAQLKKLTVPDLQVIFDLMTANRTAGWLALAQHRTKELGWIRKSNWRELRKDEMVTILSHWLAIGQEA